MATPRSKWALIFVGLLVLQGCKTNNFLSKVETDRITVSDESVEATDDAISSMILPYKTALDAKMNRIIGELTTSLDKAKPEGTLNNWMTDIIHDRAEHYYGEPVDLALQNYGGIRVNNIPAGPLAVRKIYELMPFDNKIVILKLKGEVMNKMMAHIAQDGGWPVSSSFKMTINADKSIAQALINGKPIDSNKSYVITLPDYVANGGGGTDFLKSIPQTETGWNVREAIIDYLDNHEEAMSAKIENRIILLKE